MLQTSRRPRQITDTDLTNTNYFDAQRMCSLVVGVDITEPKTVYFDRKIPLAELHNHLGFIGDFWAQTVCPESERAIALLSGREVYPQRPIHVFSRLR